MVKLKSFKLIEPIELAQDESGDSQLVEGRDIGPAHLDEVQRGRAGDETDQFRTSGSVSSSSSAKSATSLGSGGNLTLGTRSEVSLEFSERPSHREPAIRTPSPTAASSTLSSNEEFQSARIDVNEEEEEDETVSKIEIEHVKKSVASPDGPPPSQSARVSKSAQNSPLIKSTMRLQQQRIANQQQRQAHSNSPLNTPGLVRSAKMLNMPRSQTSPSPLSHMVGKLVRSTGGVGGKLSSQMNSNDSASQFSLQLKYQGSNHFEIRWQNICLFARPKSRLPQFVSGNKVYQFLFGNVGSGDQNLEAIGGELASKPPLSPLMHKIPPTIDENLEMKCPSKTTSTSLEGANNISTTFTSTSIPSLIQAQHPPPPPSDTQTTTIATASASASRCILKNISGQVFSGQMTAILGPSGVGKTSLLNSLTGRNTLEGTGRVSLIGANQSKRMSVVTVPQVDVLPNKLTVNEDLQFTSRLKNPQADFDHQRNIDRLVKHLQMDKFLHTRIQKLSGGETRRLSIARELLSSPDILILDEPTSGLDANTCKKIITALRDIVEHSDNILDKPMSIIITIHQPQQEVYQLFHRVYVMATGGRVVYEGSPQLLLPTMLEFSSVSRIAGELQIQLNENPAIVAIEVASGEFGPHVIEELAQHHESQVYEEFLGFGFGSPLTAGTGGGNFESPVLTPRSLRLHRSPMSVSRFDVQLHRKRLNSLGDASLGRATPMMSKRTTTGQQQQQQAAPTPQWDRVSQITSISYASTYDADLPEQTSRLKVDKRLRRSVVMKSHFISHTLTLVRRCWLLTTRDLFLMSIRILGFLLVAGGTVQIFSNALDPNEHQCPQFVTEVDDIPDYLQHVKQRLMVLLEMLRQGNSTHLLFFHLLLCIVMVTSALAGLVFPLQMRMFIREYKNGWYSPASFITSQTIAELPADIIGPLITLLIAYPLCHQPDSLYNWRLIGYCLIFILSSIICKSQAQIVGAILMDSVENSVFISCVAVTPAALLSGVPLRIEQMIAPLRLISYGSFLRYAFESLLELRYGFDMCPCDSNLVNGPLRASLQAVPPHLENLATGLLELSVPTAPNGTASSPTTTIGIPTGSELTATVLAANAAIGQTEHENVFIKFLRLMTNAGNMFTIESEYTDCDRYRSLYLINMGIQSNTLVRWLIVLVLMFFLSRFITYFAVRTVIRLRRT